jgi:hypothetical protein
LGVLVAPGTPGSPIAIGITNPNWNSTSTSNCYYDDATAPPQDPIAAIDSLNGTDILGNNTIDGFKGELLYPTNATNINGTTSGDFLPFDSIFNSVEQIGKTLEVMKHFILGGVIEGVVDNVAFNCSFDQDGVLTKGPESQVVTDIKSGIYIIMGVLMIITAFYWITGRGHILSS